MMDVGVALPLPADVLGDSPAAITTFVDAVAGLGFRHVAVHDHVVGIDPAAIPAPSVRYTHESRFHEPLVLLSWVAGRTPGIDLITTVLVTPQRQTVLLAKQTAELAVLSQGRLRLGVGVGVNPYEYAALGAGFTGRGRLLDEQIGLLRRLWSGQTLTERGDGYDLTATAIAPTPPEPIPIWIGGSSNTALRRAVQLGDGLVLMTSDTETAMAATRVRNQLEDAGRDPAGFSIHGFTEVITGGPDDWRERVAQAEHAGLTSLSLMTGHPAVENDIGDVDQHVERLADVAQVLGMPTRI